MAEITTFEYRGRKYIRTNIGWADGSCIKVGQALHLVLEKAYRESHPDIPDESHPDTPVRAHESCKQNPPRATVDLDSCFGDGSAKGFINLTPHDVDVIKPDGKVLTIPKGDRVLRCSVEQERCDELDSDGIPLVKSIFVDLMMDDGGAVPEPEDGVLYIVSRICAKFSHRSDFVVPNKIIRDKEGRTVGCRSLSIPK
ncbi:MAG: hypothetical protein IKD70_03225 [Eggerthellaceae bacterium]|nr:hypothetical protein [Eggerthellaceae bacterium]